MTTRRGRNVPEESEMEDQIENESEETQEEEESIMTTPNIDPQKFEAFLKWNDRNDTRKAKKTSEKNAIKQLIAENPERYNELVAENS